MRLAISLLVWMHLVAPTYGGLTSTNGVRSVNGIIGINGLSLAQGLTAGVHDAVPTVAEWNAWFRPSRFAWGGETPLLRDNRHIPEDLKTQLCSTEEGTGATPFQIYFTALLELAWPEGAELWLCCDPAAGVNATEACTDPDWKFDSAAGDGSTNPVWAPDFLTDRFGPGQQEALTAALIAEFNVLGKHLEMDLHGRFDLGGGETRFFAGKVEGFDYHLGNAWGNAFLDCFGDDQDDILCQASKEEDRTIGRASQFFGVPMFTCSGESNYPTRASGKSCFSSDMAENERDGCGLVASVGPCDRVCVGGFCGVNDPPLEHRGTTNVLYVYLKEYKHDAEEDTTDKVLKIVLPILVALLLVALVAWMVWNKKKVQHAHVSAVVTTNDHKLPLDGITDAGSDASKGDTAEGETIEI